MNMKFNQLTDNIAKVTLALYGIYALFVMGIGSVILSLAIGLIALAFFDRLEIVVPIVVIVGMIASYVIKPKREGFINAGSDGKPLEIVNRIERMQKKEEVQGVYGPELEGFQDVSESKEVKEGASSESTPAEKTEIKNQVAIATGAPTPAEEKKDVMKAVNDLKKDMGVAKPKEEISAFASQPGLFKLGELPSESKEGPIVDAGSTLMKALGSLQPDQMKSMTEETQKMIATQKNMLEMLQSMRPVLQDGQQLLQSFSGIFGSGPLKLGV
jgi:hypothetical protein